MQRYQSKEGMVCRSSRPLHSLWSVYCVLCGSVALTSTHWPMYRACIHKANLFKTDFEIDQKESVLKLMLHYRLDCVPQLVEERLRP
jgi:hypothetical protein